MRRPLRFGTAWILSAAILLSATGVISPTGVVLAAQPSISIDPTAGFPGTLVTYQGTGFTPGGGVSVLLVPGLGLVVDEKVADTLGRVGGSFVIPNPVGKAEMGFGPVGVFAIDRVTGAETASVSFNIQRPSVDGRIEIVFPHDEQGNVRSVSEAPLVNVSVFLFETGTLNPVPCNFPNTVRLRWALNLVSTDGTASQLPTRHEVPGIPVPGAAGTRTMQTIDSTTFPTWVFNDVPVPFVQRANLYDPTRSKQFFVVEVQDADFRTNVWSHGQDPRTFFPAQFQPSSRGATPTSPLGITALRTKPC